MKKNVSVTQLWCEMKNEHLWQPSRIVRNAQTEVFAVNRKVVYSGSYHIAVLQLNAYLPLLKQYVKGEVLDAGCGSIPYYDIYRQQINSLYCVDKSEHVSIAQHLDEQVDLNETFVLQKKNFDTVLLTDVIAHISHPQLLLGNVANHMSSGGHCIITTPFVYWASEHPHEFFHPTDIALRMMCKATGMEVIHLQPYGGHADVMLDTLNKAMTNKWSNRFFRMLASVVKKTAWYGKTNEKNRYSYALGYTVVARKL